MEMKRKMNGKGKGSVDIEEMGERGEGREGKKVKGGKKRK